MELIITAVFLVNVLNINAIYIEKNNKNTTVAMKERNEQLFHIASKHIVNVTEMKLPSHLAAKPKCLRTCWWLQGGCYNMTTNTCYCPNDTVMIGTQCFDKSYLGEFCFYDEQCQAPNSGCFISSIARTCQCKTNYVRIHYSCYETVSLGEFCLISEQCKTQNSRCVNFCMCKYGYTRYGDKCLPDYNERTNFKQMDNIVIAVIGTFVGFIVFAIILSITSYIKRQSSLSSVQVNEVSTVQIPHEFRRGHIPPEFGIVHTPPENSGFNATPQTQVNVRTNNPREPILSNSDKPPSYEHIMRSSINSSTCNLIGHEEIPEESCPSYASAIQK
ncbi:uncharacterized protein [Centruroides vittatus]|uniref:uncharacterized protein n=1 Tax=Centruroides vittatus TaxID=120091 RepID=UPI003510CAED